MNSVFIQIIDGRIDNRTTMQKFVQSLPTGRYECKMIRKNKRSNLQNAYYWQMLDLVVEGLQNIGYPEVKTSDDAHEILKHLFLKKVYANPINGDEIVIAGSTTKLTKLQFSEYLEDIWRWASEYLSITIPAPNESLKMFS